MSNKPEMTPRQRVEAIVIDSREAKVTFCGSIVIIRGMPWGKLKSLWDKVHEFIGHILDIQDLESHKSPIVKDPGGSAKADSPGTGGLSLNFDSVFKLGPEFAGLIEDIITASSDVSKETIDAADWFAVLQLTRSVLEMNIGPEIQSFFSNASERFGTLIQTESAIHSSETSKSSNPPDGQ